MAARHPDGDRERGGVAGAEGLCAITGLRVGNLVGGVVRALHSAQGPRLGRPQMISSRAQFGVFGAAVPLVLVIIMYLGFAATGTVLAGQAVNQIVHVDAPVVGIVIFGVLTAIVATLGYRYIHVLGRIATVVGILGFTYLVIRLVTNYDVGTLIGQKPFEAVTFLLAISLAAGWQLTFGPYVADYSRYLPQDTPESTTFRSTFLGSVIGSQVSMTLGALVASLPLVNGKGFLDNQVGFLGELAGGGLVADLIYRVIVRGQLDGKGLNDYGGRRDLPPGSRPDSAQVLPHRRHRQSCVAAVLLSVRWRRRPRAHRQGPRVRVGVHCRSHSAGA